jgi:hypothetical protein
MYKITVWYNGMSFSKTYECKNYEWGEGHSGILIFRDITTPKTKAYYISIHNTDCIEFEYVEDPK